MIAISYPTFSVFTQSFSVPFQYDVWFTQGLFDASNPVFVDVLTRVEPEKKHRIVVFVDNGILAGNGDAFLESIKNYATAHHDRIELVTDPIAVQGGETIKVALDDVELMQKVLFEHHIDRHSYVVGIGGGAMLDAVGWVAATAHRGVRHIRVPTTVLGQNDSGVGVKNGINRFGVKNYMGSFAPPFAVINDLDFVLTLPKRDQVAGMAEAVKVALIRDKTFFEWLEKNADSLSNCDPQALEYLIRRCAELHMHQIAHGGDPFEMGSARPLDYGHWSAHKIESMTNYSIRHGEAVAIGLVLDAIYSQLMGYLSASDVKRISGLLERLGFCLWNQSLLEEAEGSRIVLQGLRDFKEHLGGELCITLLDSIGVGFEVNEMDELKVLDAIHCLQDDFAN